MLQLLQQQEPEHFTEATETGGLLGCLRPCETYSCLKRPSKRHACLQVGVQSPAPASGGAIQAVAPAPVPAAVPAANTMGAGADRYIMVRPAAVQPTLERYVALTARQADWPPGLAGVAKENGTAVAAGVGARGAEGTSGTALAMTHTGISSPVRPGRSCARG